MNKNIKNMGAGHSSLNRSFVIAGLGMAMIVTGCSSQVTRFDDPPFGLTESGSKKTPRPTAPMMGRADVQDGSYRNQNGDYQQAASNRERQVRTAALPALRESAPAINKTQYVPAARTPQPAYELRPATRPAYTPKTPREPSGGTLGEIKVRHGDTLYGLSRAHKVSINALMHVNGLTSTTLRPGQVLKLPTGAIARPAATSVSAPRQQKALSQTPARTPASWRATYTVKSGDSLYLIARRYGIKTTDLQRYNGINNPRRVRPGRVLMVPGNAADTGTAPSQIASNNARTGTPARLNNPNRTTPGPRQGQRAGIRPRVAVLNAKPVNGLGGPQFTQSVSITPPKIEAPDTTKLRWPVHGKIISKFGRRADGTHNDGINLAVPAGSDVKAAEAGVVAYSGSELRGYGKLILIRHENGWVTAYAHNRDILVKRGDKVSRGQVIAKAGKTGQVDRPQVHFELRRDAKPVDPTPYLETL